MNWYILAILSAFLAAINALIQRLALKNKKLDPVTYSIYFQLFISLVFLSIALVRRDNFGTPAIENIFHYSLLTLFYGAGNFLVFYTLSKIEASRFVIVFSSRALFSFLGFYFISQVTNSLDALLGIILILIGIVTVNIEGLNVRFSKYDATALLAGMCYGFANVNDRYLLEHFDLYPYLFLAFFLPAVLTAVIRPKAVIDFQLFRTREILIPVLISVLTYTIGSLVFFYTLKIAPDPSKVVGINMVSIIITVLGGYFFLNEKTQLGRKLIGAVFCLLGLLLTR